MSQTKSRTKAQPEGLRGVLCAWCGQQGMWAGDVDVRRELQPAIIGCIRRAERWARKQAEARWTRRA